MTETMYQEVLAGLSQIELLTEHPLEIELQERGYNIWRTPLCGWSLERDGARYHCDTWPAFLELAGQLLEG